MIPVRRETLDRLAGYLLSRPMAEVEQLVNLLRMDVLAADKAAAAAAQQAEERIDA